MPITIKVGDFFDSQAQRIVNAVNCVGVMGKGIALEYKKRFPDMFADYKKKCANNEVLSRNWLYELLSVQSAWLRNLGRLASRPYTHSSTRKSFKHANNI
ncbi:MAG: macro domain-containing protein [Candidatus Melainabacteria bacterium]|nr:macro domain-containing protein [Candidatus Melainabacteria bacterium]